MVASFHLKDGRAGGTTYTVPILRLLRPSAGGDWQNELTIVLVWDVPYVPLIVLCMNIWTSLSLSLQVSRTVAWGTSHIRAPGLPATLNPYRSPSTEWVFSLIISLSPPHRLLDVVYEQKESKDKLATSKVSKQRQRIQIDHSEYTSIHWQMAVLSLNY